MHPELTQFEHWLTCQYPHSSTRKHYMSDLVLFFSWAEKQPTAVTPGDVEKYINHCIAKSLWHVTINRRLSALRTFYYFLSIVNDVPIQCPIIPGVPLPLMPVLIPI